MEREQQSAPEISLDDIRHILKDLYVPFAEIERAINWPTDFERLENDAEHSFSVALVSGAVAERLGLDADRAFALGVVHDLVERHAKDSVFWDPEAMATKAQREAEALERIKQDYQHFPYIAALIEEYEELSSDEAKLVKVIDKIIAIVMLMESEGHFWKRIGITHEQHAEKYAELRHTIALSPPILPLYDELIAELERDKELYFAVVEELDASGEIG